MALFRLLVSAGVLCLCMPVSAATSADKDRARAKAVEAEKRYNVGEFQAALEGYKEAYLLNDAPSLLFNIGQCQWKLGDDRAALHSYRAYLRTMPNPPNRSLVETRIAEIEQRLKAAEAGRPNDVVPTPADRTAAAAASAGSATAPAISLTPTAPPVEANPSPGLATPLESSPPATSHFYSRWWFWTGAAVVVAGVVTTVLLLRSSPKDPTCPAGASCG